MVQWLRADYDFEGFMTLSPMLSLFLLLWKRVNSPSNELPNINIASKPGHSPTCSLAVLQSCRRALPFSGSLVGRLRRGNCAPFLLIHSHRLRESECEEARPANN